MKALLIASLCASPIAAQSTHHIPLNYNYNGIVHAGEEGNPDSSNGYRSISDRGLNFTGGVPNDSLLNKYSIVSSPGALDIVHLGNRNTIMGGLFAFDGSPDGDDVGTIPSWMTSINQSSPQTTSLGSPIALSGYSEASFIYQISNGGGLFEVVFGFQSGVNHTARLGGGDWFGGPYAGTSNADFALFEMNLSITEGSVDLSAYAGETLTSITFQNRTNLNGGCVIIAANLTVGAPTPSVVHIPLDYNHNGIIHINERGFPDDPDGFRSISDRALNFHGGMPTDALVSSYEVVNQAGELDIVHLGNRDTVAGGVWGFQPIINGDDVGVQPNWMSSVDQSGSQTTALPSPLLLGSGARAKLIYQISNDGGLFKVVCHFQNGASITQTVGAGDWYNGGYPGTGFVDQGWPDLELSITEALVDLSAAAGEVLTHITFKSPSNPIAGYAILAAKVIAGAPVGTIYCAGDGSASPCPCGNTGATEQGCANGTGQGARITSEGTNSLSADDFRLTASNMIPNQPGLYFQGNNATGNGLGTQFGDGLRCAGGGVIRLQVRFTDSDGESETSADLISLGGVVAGDTKHYQCWYRDPVTSLCGTQFNLTNGYEVIWVP